MYKIIFIFLCFLNVTRSTAQGDIYSALNKFINQDFFKQFKELKDRAENSAKSFKINQRRYPEDKSQEVIEAYNASIDNFNRILFKIKADMLNKSKRKYITQFPDGYANELQSYFTTAKDFYDQNYRKKIAELTEDDKAGVGVLLLLPDMIKYATLAFNIIKQISDQLKKLKETMLDNYLIAPYKIKSWNELNLN